MSKFRREAPELREAVEVLRQGGCVLMFPEGILRRKEKLILRQFGQGVWHILREVPDTPVQVLWIEGGWGSYLSYRNGPPGKGKRMDFWRRIDVAVPEAERLDAEVLVDHRTTRRYLMRKCLESRRILGLDVPEGPIPGLAEFTEEEQPDEVA
jgi:1-acyl-sn-glycerol-3-phosphate acyltransferase